MRLMITCFGVVLAALAGARTAQATIADLVNQVSQTNLVAHVAALEGDRSGPAAQAAAASYIRSTLESYGYVVESQPVGGSENLIATLPGLIRPDEIFVLGAHFDTVPGSPGADDNASGVAAVLESARILASEPLERTVQLLFFALEESGYQGSEAYAAALAGAGADVIGMISLDMIGYTCATPGCQFVLPDIPGCLSSTVQSDVGDWIGYGANTASVPLLVAFLANAEAHVPALGLEGFVIQGNGSCFSDSRRSDHKSFWDEGYPAIILGDGAEARNPNYHQASDTLSTLDFAFMALVTRALVAHLASSGLPPAVPGIGPLASLLLACAMSAGAGLARRRRAGALRPLGERARTSSDE